MKIYLYKILLFFLNLLVYLKRAVFWCLRGIGSLFETLDYIFRNTIGFRWYKWELRVKKKLEKFRFSDDRGVLSILGKRSTLQIVFLLIAVLVSLPHSKIYTQEIAELTGRDTILYSLVGPGNQNFKIQEVEVDVSKISANVESDRWKRGAVSQDSSYIGKRKFYLQQNISTISVGGTALTKPKILQTTTSSDKRVKDVSTQSSQNRKDVKTYIVKSGDVIGAIASRYGVSVESILWANDLSYNSYIKPGDELTIPPVSGVIHTVDRGDTVGEIARRYDAEIEDVINYNDLQQGGSNISVGQKLVIPEGEQPTQAQTQSSADSSQLAQQKENELREVSAPPPSASAPAGSGYLWPTKVHRITQYFGWRHTGLDIAGPRGTPLYASKTGSVVRSRCGWNGGYGCYVIIDHGSGIKTLYAHAYRLLVNRGDRVTQGQTVALMGSTGRSTGPHIHFEVRVNGRRQNPLKYIR